MSWDLKERWLGGYNFLSLPLSSLSHDISRSLLNWHKLLISLLSPFPVLSCFIIMEEGDSEGDDDDEDDDILCVP